MKSFGKTLKIFVMGEDPRALKTVELSNWTGLAFIGSRGHLSHVKERPELREPAIYILLSESGEGSDGLTAFYVGETDNFSKRLAEHVQEKDWWDQFVVFVSKDNNLTKAHVKHLEKELHDLAKSSVGTLKIMNSNAPGGAKLPESDLSSMAVFMENMRFVLETLSLSYFPSGEDSEENSEIMATARRPLDVTSLEGVTFYMTHPKDVGLVAGQPHCGKMIVRKEMYVLLPGSYIRRVPHDSFKNHQSYFSLWEQISKSDRVEKTDNEILLRTTKEIEFRSPSAAGAIVRGRSTNGRENWLRVADGKSLAACEAEEVKKTA
ncbi:MAG: GIY-YIG nuclease family protein [Bdellovibrionales bacterium]|nr:GIY-YIG nuclease family protein [Bdellovibrionales bacterium]